MVEESNKTDSIFWSAVRIAAPEERDRFLNQACGDDSNLRAQLDELLAAYPKVERFLEQPAYAADATANHETPITERPGTVIGPYKLLQQIGEGGMGVVFMAEQTEPIQRTVALKIIKPGMDTRQVIARFEAERQALAMMDHPNIARVLDAGTTGGESRVKDQEPSAESASSPALDARLSTLDHPGRPYFVMELVKGVPITDYCDQQHLTVRQRLEQFTQVCQAVQHAHQKGIIHRDLKPSNVLVAEYDGKPVPKVIDFGVAKATAQRLTERTMFTQYGQIVGTFEYMSPEQARFNQLDVDTRSDIYSLGVLLYELLAGSTPLEKERLRAAAFDEILRIIGEEDPPKPSTRLSSLSLGERASSHPLPLGEGRGEGASSLASIAANRHTEPARLSKDVRGELDWIVMKALEKDRNRRYETASGFAADIERHLNDKPVEAGPPSAVYRFRKFARRNKAAVLVTSAIAGILIAATSISVWQAAIARDALKLAETRLESETRARKEADAAKTQAKNEAARAESEAQKATTSAQTAQAVVDFLNRDLLGQANDNLPRDMHSRFDGEVTIRGALDRASKKLDGRFPDKPMVEAAIRQTVGTTYAFFGEDYYHQAEPHLARALKLRQIHLGEDNVETIRSLLTLAIARDDLQLHRDAMRRAQTALGEDHELTQWCKFDLAILLLHSGEEEEAELLLRSVLAAQRQTLGPQHADTGWTELCLADALERGGATDPNDEREIEQLLRHALSVSLQSLGDWSWHSTKIAQGLALYLRTRGRLDEAARVLQDCYARLKSGPVSVEWIVPVLNELETLDAERGNAKEATHWRKTRELEIQKGLSRNSRLLRDNLDDPGLLISHASLLTQLGQHKQAEAAYRAAIALQPNDPRARHLLGDCLIRRQDFAAAEAEIREAIRLAGNSAFDTDWHRLQLGTVLLRQGKLVEAEADFREAIRLRPNNPWHHHWLGDLLKEQNRWVEAEAAYRVAIRLEPNDPGRYRNLADAMAGGGKVADAAEELRAAAERHPTSATWQRSYGSFLSNTMHEPNKALPILEDVARRDPDDFHTQYDLGNAHAMTGRWSRALPVFRRAVDLCPDDDPEGRYRLAALCIYTGDIDGYREVCRDMLVRFGDSDNPNFIDRTAKICLLASDADDNRERALVLAAKNLSGTEQHPDYRWFVIAKGLADYRAGRYADAVRWIEHFAPNAEGGHSDATGFSVLAMARYRLNQAESATNSLASARKILATSMPNPEEGRPFGNDWNDWLHSQVVFREAEGMIERQTDEGPLKTELEQK